MPLVRVELPAHLCQLAGIRHHADLTVPAPATIRAILDALEQAHHPTLRGTIRDHATLVRRPFIRFFACQQDLSHISHDEPLPAAVANATEPFIIIGAIAGG